MKRTATLKTLARVARPMGGHDVILVRHGELGLKSPRVRARLERTLTRRIEEALARHGVESLVRRIYSRHLVEASDLDAAMRCLTRVFGVTTFSLATRAPVQLDALAAAAAEYARTHWPAGAQSFAIRARRTGTHPYTSRELSVTAGSAVWNAMKETGVDVRVDLGAPDFAIEIEVRNKEAYLHHARHAGPGGLPLGSQGRVALWVSGSDAAAAAYLMMRRGAEVVPYALAAAAGKGQDGTGADAEGAHPAERLMESLAAWGAPGRVHLVRSAAAEPQATAHAAGDPWVAFARDALAAGVHMARERGAHAVVTAETARVPWAHRLPETHPGGEIPILRPLMGLDRGIIDDFREIVGLSRRGAARGDSDDRAYTAGGRGLGTTYAQRTAIARGEDAWDPW